MQIRKFLLASGALGAVAGCTAPDGRYPDLAIRDYEQVNYDAVDAASREPLVPLPLPAEIANRVAGLFADTQRAHSRFLNELPAARRAAARAGGGAVSSKAKGDALVMLAVLDAAHAEVLEASSKIDTIYSDAHVAGQDLSEIGPIREAALRMVAEQEAAIAAIARQIGQ